MKPYVYLKDNSINSSKKKKIVNYKRIIVNHDYDVSDKV